MLVPFDYEVECLSAIEKARRNSQKKALVVMASGLGKTVTTAFDVKSWRRENSGRVLYLCHQNDILYQAKTTFEGVIGHEYSYGYFHGQEKTPHDVDFLFASLQTMEKRKKRFDRREFAYIVVDESHHSQADTFRSTIEYFEPEFLLGITATPDRLDQLDIRSLYGEEIFSLPLEEAMARGLLTPVDYRLLTDEIQFAGTIEAAKERWSIKRLNKTLFIPRRDEEIATIITRYVSEVKDPRVIIFCSSVEHCDRLSHFLPDSFAIHSRVPSKERAIRTELFRQGLVGTILTVDMFNEGIDIPKANVIAFLRSTVSSTIFLQQLGRGLRKSEGKEKVVVLDFVANCERIRTVHKLWTSVKERQSPNSRTNVEPMTINLKSVEFQEKIVPILEVLKRFRGGLYATWQEASSATQSLGITTVDQYRETYRKDPRLPADPWSMYEDFPGFNVFLGRERRFYATWQEASQAAQALGITSSTQYYAERQYRNDRLLPSSPERVYTDFPGWVVFFGKIKKDFYPTWKEAGAATRGLGIKSIKEYDRRYREDARLPSDPSLFYDDFPNWPSFLKNNRKAQIRGGYPSWQEASLAAIALGARSSVGYRKVYKKDPRLPSGPPSFYKDFPGWDTFLGISPETRQKAEGERAEKYRTWEECSSRVRELRIRSDTEYRRRRSEDPLLPAAPDRYKGFPGWQKFLGKK